jgi:hypothetical protein
MPIPPVLLGCAAALLGFLSASTCAKPVTDDPISTTAADTLVAGCAGGVTGGGSGVAITGAGFLLRWTRPGPGATEWTVVRRDSTETARLFSRLSTVKFDQTDFTNPSNMTCFLERRGATPHEIGWPMGQRPRQIAAILALYDDIVRLATN